MSAKTHWKQLINPDHFGAYALPDGKDLTVTIDYVVRKTVTGSGGKKDECTVAHLIGNKPLVLNVTNSKSIAKLYGAYIEDWRGKKITLFASTTKLAGDMVECIRIRPQVTIQKQAITEARLLSAIKSINDGDFTLEKLNEKFQLTKEQAEQVREALKPVQNEATENLQGAA